MIISVEKFGVWFPCSANLIVEATWQKNGKACALSQVSFLKDNFFLHGNLWVDLCSQEVKAEFYFLESKLIVLLSTEPQTLPVPLCIGLS